MMEIPSGKCCEMCPFDHKWDMKPPKGESYYVCAAFSTEPCRKEDYRNLSCFAAYPHGATVTITPKDVVND